MPGVAGPAAGPILQTRMLAALQGGCRQLLGSVAAAPELCILNAASTAHTHTSMWLQLSAAGLLAPGGASRVLFSRFASTDIRSLLSVFNMHIPLFRVLVSPRPLTLGGLTYMSPPFRAF